MRTYPGAGGIIHSLSKQSNLQSFLVDDSFIALFCRDITICIVLAFHGSITLDNNDGYELLHGQLKENRESKKERKKGKEETER